MSAATTVSPRPAPVWALWAATVILLGASGDVMYGAELWRSIRSSGMDWGPLCGRAAAGALGALAIVWGARRGVRGVAAVAVIAVVVSTGQLGWELAHLSALHRFVATGPTR